MSLDDAKSQLTRILRELGISVLKDRDLDDVTGFPLGIPLPDGSTITLEVPFPGPLVIMHADRGSQYHSTSYRSALKRLEIRQSTSRTGSCLDGAAAESFFAAIKAEIGIGFWPDRASARCDIENWIKSYNERRLHSALGYRTPSETRRTWQERMATAA